MATKIKKIKQFISAKNGRFVTEAYANRHKSTTVSRTKKVKIKG